MLDAWLNGDVPRQVMADWCEERGLPFGRAVPSVMTGSSLRGRRRHGFATRSSGHRCAGWGAETRQQLGSRSCGTFGVRSTQRRCSVSGSSRRAVAGTPISPRDAVRAAIRAWSSLLDLAVFAEERMGFGDTNGGFGVNYPEHVDDYDRVAQGNEIPDGFLAVYGFWGPPDGYELLVPEDTYLDVLAELLDEDGEQALARRVRLLRSNRR